MGQEKIKFFKILLSISYLVQHMNSGLEFVKRPKQVTVGFLGEQTEIPCAIREPKASYRSGVTLAQSVLLKWVFKDETIFRNDMKFTKIKNLFLKQTRFNQTTAYYLHINDTNFSNAGDYSCMASVLLIAKTTLIIAGRPSMPIVSYEPALQNVYYGTNITLRCLVHGGFPNLQLIWYSGNAILSQSAVFDNDNKDQTIEKIKEINVTISRKYRVNKFSCTAQLREIPESRSTSVLQNLTILYPPEIKMSVEPKRLKIGRPFRVTCNVSANPVPIKILWKRNNISINGTLNSLKVSEYVIRSASKDHEGTYECTSTNELGNATGTIRLYLEVNLKVRKRSTSTLVLAIALPIILNIMCIGYLVNKRCKPPVVNEDQKVKHNEEVAKIPQRFAGSRSSSVYSGRITPFTFNTLYNTRPFIKSARRSQSHERMCKWFSPHLSNPGEVEQYLKCNGECLGKTAVDPSDPLIREKTSDLHPASLELQLNTKLNTMPYSPQLLAVKKTVMEAAFPPKPPNQRVESPQTAKLPTIPQTPNEHVESPKVKSKPQTATERVETPKAQSKPQTAKDRLESPKVQSKPQSPKERTESPKGPSKPQTAKERVESPKVSSKPHTSKQEPHQISKQSNTKKKSSGRRKHSLDKVH